MKVWYGYGSDHSMNLVMIGQFKDASDAESAKQVIDRIEMQVQTDVEAGIMGASGETHRFGADMLALLSTSYDASNLNPEELSQFMYDVSVLVEDDKIVITTDEIGVSAFLKILINKGARVEVYSAHNYSNTGYGRGVMGQ